MALWKIGGRDVDGFITSYICSVCGYRIRPRYLYSECPGCHVDMTITHGPHYNVSQCGDDWWHYELLADNKLMKVTVDDNEIFKDVIEVWTNDKEKKIRVKNVKDILHERSFSSFQITSYEKGQNNE